jgi:hypothetical protein
MRRSLVSLSLAAAAVIAAAALLPGAGSAQTQLPRPGQLPPPGGQTQQKQQQPGPKQQQPQQTQQQPQPAPPAPYQPVAISAPAPISDPGFETFRKQIADIAQRKDRNALARLIVAQGFFWDGEKGDKADKRRPGIDNLAKALNLPAKDGSGWETLSGYASDPTGSTPQHRQNVTCAPGDPVFDGKALEALVKSTRTEDFDWGFPTQPNIEVRGGPQANAPVIDKLGMHFVRVMPENPQSAPPATNQAPPSALRIVTPSGKVGYVGADAISPLGADQLCYLKDASGAWKIAGFIGGEQ